MRNFPYFSISPIMTNLRLLGCVLPLTMLLPACGTMPDWMSASGPSAAQIETVPESETIAGVHLLDVDDALARKLASATRPVRFDQVFPHQLSKDHLVGPGDVIEISVWEAPPTMLFGAVTLDPGTGTPSTRPVVFPEQMVASDGKISIPFAGRIPVEGRSTQQIELEITRRLSGKANQPQVLARVMKNNTANVTVVGDVKSSVRMPLTARGERLLDALAAGGGVSQPVHRMAVQISRAEVTATMPLDLIIRDPGQNIPLQPGDVVTALFQSQSFSILGATGKNEEIPFEAKGISLAQALARAGGLADNRADARGVFVFRFADKQQVAPDSTLLSASDGTIPVVYRINLRDPAAFFATQNFQVRDKDVIYVANSPEAELNKFLRLIVTVASPATTLNRAFQ